ncbi:YdcF family protein [Allokutzneria oryzae]|uniref:YdcF family protein n=1 Tax=Allokutzneria oryzae TaxID=1378989 RepID=A0ABV6A7R4_9PSEU
MTEPAPRRRPSRARWVRRALFGAVLVAGLVVGGTAARVWQVARLDDQRPADIVVVLGAAQYNGKPSEVLEARLNHAQRLYERGVAKTVVTVGGAREGDAYSEAEAGKRWLLGTSTRAGSAKESLPSDRVIALTTGSDTLGSIRAVAEEAKQQGWRSAVIVSDPWHSLRSRTMAQDFGLAAWASPTRRGPIVATRETQINYIVRETGALLYYRLTHAPANDHTGLG